MSFIVETIPQKLKPLVHVTITELFNILPKQIHPINVWIGGSIARYGKTTGALIFLLEQKNEPSAEQRLFFSEIVLPLKAQATASNNWRDEKITAIRVYDNGQLVQQPFKEVDSIPEITKDYVLSKLPKTIPFPLVPVYLTGSIVKQGWSRNDVDFITNSSDVVLVHLRNYFTQILGCKVHVGKAVMPEREPVYLYKIYDKGAICLP